MNKIRENNHEILIGILEQLLNTLVLLRKETNDFILKQNEEEALEWISFLKKHTYKEELKSLENEIANRFFYKFDVEISESELDKKRTDLIKDYLLKSNEFLK